jgi:hypothetical protein
MTATVRVQDELPAAPSSGPGYLVPLEGSESCAYRLYCRDIHLRMFAIGINQAADIDS